MAQVRMEGSEGATQWAKDLCGDDPLSLDTIQSLWFAQRPAEGLQGDPTDHAWIELECRRILGLGKVEPIALAHVRESLKRVTEEQAKIIAQAMAVQQPGHSEDDCAATILSYCPYDIEQNIQLSEEAWQAAGLQMSRARIIASVILANRNGLHAGDVTELSDQPTIGAGRGMQPPSVRPSNRPDLAPATCPELETISIVDEALGTLSIKVHLCGKTFVPKRMGVRYGCNACGEIANKARVWLIESAEQVKRGVVRSLDAVPPFKVPADLREACSCGQAGLGQMVHAA